MGTNTLETAYSNGQIIDASHINELTASLLNQFVGRNTSGVPEAGKSLGTAAIPWGAGYFNSLTLNGKVVDPDTVTTVANKLVSSRTRAASSLPDFIEVDGAAAEFTIKAAVENILLSINGQAVTVSSDIVKTGLTLAPNSGNTALVNDTSLADQYYTKHVGEDGVDLNIDNAGVEFTSRVGQFIAFKFTNEIAFGFLKSTSIIENCYRGFYFDNTRAPIVREVLTNNDTLTLLNIGWVFIEDNGTTVDVSYTTPIYQYEAPSSPVTGQYWFDIPNQTWKRYSGTEFEIINRTLVGQVVMDDTACIAYRCLDFTRNFSENNNVEVELESTSVVRSLEPSSRISVYGTEVVQDNAKLDWNITTDLESGLTEAASTLYYMYLSEEGQRIISDEKPHYRADLKGDYHPYHSWRLVGFTFNDSSSDFDGIYSEIFASNQSKSFASFSTSNTSPTAVTDAEVTVLHRGRGDAEDIVAIESDWLGGGIGSGYGYTIGVINVQDKITTTSTNINGVNAIGFGAGGEVRMPYSTSFSFTKTVPLTAKGVGAFRVRAEIYRVNTGTNTASVGGGIISHRRLNKQL